MQTFYAQVSGFSVQHFMETGNVVEHKQVAFDPAEHGLDIGV